tara:strand:+ start:4460 stop:4771 length:312 start_codon:yes stop_codon:yes gene_type:complete
MICISTTSNSEKVLKKISREVLNNKLSACTQIYEIYQSGYEWENEIVYNSEFKLDIKTINSYQSEIVSIIKKNHNYNVYELIVFQINSINEEYNKWFNNQIKK